MKKRKYVKTDAWHLNQRKMWGDAYELPKRKYTKTDKFLASVEKRKLKTILGTVLRTTKVDPIQAKLEVERIMYFRNQACNTFLKMEYGKDTQMIELNLHLQSGHYGKFYFTFNEAMWIQVDRDVWTTAIEMLKNTAGLVL